MEKTKESGSDKPELDREFNQLRELTNQYTILGDVCGTYAAVYGTYAAVYNMLSEADEAYQT
ncbi:hypothetical protein CU011_2178 [Enterococcus faecium]|nr:hypothetical protein [Enterococcus faecium]MBK4862338.1 hypothetical protein [Enterococcus faecium]